MHKSEMFRKSDLLLEPWRTRVGHNTCVTGMAKPDKSLCPNSYVQLAHFSQRFFPSTRSSKRLPTAAPLIRLFLLSLSYTGAFHRKPSRFVSPYHAQPFVDALNSSSFLAPVLDRIQRRLSFSRALPGFFFFFFLSPSTFLYSDMSIGPFMLHF